MSCVSCHQFHGPPENENLCSSCYRVAHPEAAREQQQIQKQKQEYKDRWNALIAEGDLSKLIEFYEGPTPFPKDIMEAMVRDLFKDQVRAGKINICEAIMNHEPFKEIIFRLCPNILSDVLLNSMRHRYGSAPGPNHLALFDYLVSFPDFKSKLSERDLQTTLCIHQGTEMIQRMLDISREGIFELTKASLETAQYLNKRPNNVPTPEKKNHILMVKAALEEQKQRKRNDKRKREGGIGEGEVKGEDEDEDDEEETSQPYAHVNYIRDMVKFGADEGDIPFNNEAVGMKIFPAADEGKDKRRRQYYTVIEFKKQRGGNSRLVVQKVGRDQEILELDEDAVMTDWIGGPSPKQHSLWSTYQEKVISEGVWTSSLSGDLQVELNTLVDQFAATEPVDYHPGTKDIVRDLVHPSLYPLILSTTKPKGKKKYDDTQKNFFNRLYEVSRFQWLPSEVDIDGHGIARFVTPINNLDEAQYPQLYDCLGRVLTHLVPGFEQVWSYAQTVSFNDQFDDLASTNPPPISFANKRLQVIVKLTEYEFKPNDFFDGVWHYEGMSHENIVMTGLFYPYTDERLRGQGIEFKRQFTDKEAQVIAGSVPQERPKWLEEQIANGFTPLGHITTETSKLIVFPNCHAHRVMRIENPTNEVLKRRLLAFFVIDPMKRIESTLEHPPLPRQVPLKKALQDRLDLMKERKYYKESLNPRHIELCEH